MVIYTSETYEILGGGGGGAKYDVYNWLYINLCYKKITRYI